MESDRALELLQKLEKVQHEEAHYRLVQQKKIDGCKMGLSYEEWRKSIMVAHLKPIQGLKFTDENVKAGFPTSSVVRSSSSKDSSNSISTQSHPFVAKTVDLVAPKTSMEFTKTWKGLSSDASRVEYLKTIAPSSLSSIFKTEMDATTISAIIRVFLYWIQETEQTDAVDGKEEEHEEAEYAKAIFVLNFLEAVSRLNRFALNYNFTPATTKSTATLLFAQLHQRVLKVDGEDSDVISSSRDLATVFKASQ